MELVVQADFLIASKVVSICSPKVIRLAKKMVEDGKRTMIPFNTFFKDKLSIAKDHFKKVSSFNGIVEFCKTEMYDRDKSDGYHWNNYGDTVGQFSFHVLNLFGLDYKKFIKNEKLVNVVDNYLIMEFT